MLEVGWTEMLVIAIVMIVVVGPKDLPKMLRTFGRTTAKLRTMAGDFQRQFNEALREAELDDVKKSVDDLKKLNPTAEIRKQLNPFEKAAADVRAGLDSMNKPKPAATTPQAAEPLKNGATGEIAAAAPEVKVAGPDKMPEPPVFAADPPSPAVHAAEPLKNGAAVLPAEKPAAKAKAAAKPRAAAASKPAAKAKTASASGRKPAGKAS